MSAADEALGRPVFVDGGYKPFGQLTRVDVDSLAAELSAAARGAAALARVAPVARAWTQLSRALAAAGVETVGELDPEVALDSARRTWVLPPRLL